MRKLRDLVVLLATAAAFAISLMFIRQLIAVRSPWFGFILMLDVLGLAAIARPLVTLRLPGYFVEPLDLEKSGRFTRLIGVPKFGGLLRRTALRHLNTEVYLRGNLRPDIVQRRLVSAEVAHILAAAILVPWMVFALNDRHWGALAVLVLVQIIGNLYPILHLRWTRVRLDRLRDRVGCCATFAGQT